VIFRLGFALPVDTFSARAGKLAVKRKLKAKHFLKSFVITSPP
jgi:hypothetical protein